MHFPSLRIRPLFLTAAIAVASSCMMLGQARAGTPTLWLIGDSTVKNGTKGLRGWGEEIGAYFDSSKIKVENRALGGRSSRTYLTEGLWDKVAAEIKPADFV